uniref:Uncharacterized protein n=1 Tax=Mesocestoides corti TaxID=53468 RepID=A0A5K3EYS9_MESCO
MQFTSREFECGGGERRLPLKEVDTPPPSSPFFTSSPRHGAPRCWEGGEEGRPCPHLPPTALRAHARRRANADLPPQQPSWALANYYRAYAFPPRAITASGWRCPQGRSCKINEPLQ